MQVNSSVRKIGIVNPLGFALSHYADRVQNVIGKAPGDIIRATVAEPSQAEYGRLSWVWRHYRAILKARFQGQDPIFVLWPPLGLIDLFLTQLICGRRGRVVIHDPEPLVASIGYGEFAAFLARRCKRSEIIVHSSVAKKALWQRYRLEARCVPLPAVISPCQEVQSTRPDGRPILTVFGQYKPDRDILLMAKLAQALQQDFDLRVVGRRWPEVQGWSVDSRFVPEDEIDEIISRSSAILIPYKRFFQSDIAIRCLELKTPFVGPRGSSLVEIVGHESPILASSSLGDWLRAIRYAAKQPKVELEQIRAAYLREMERAWISMLTE